MKTIVLIITGIAFTCFLNAQHVKPFGPVPTPMQQAWADKEFYIFTHFGPNTFTDLEWGKGTEHEEVFNPTQLDCMQWCRIAKAAGAKGIIITAKHHDGFCLWPSKYSTHTVAQSKWKNGKGDVLQELATACKKSGLSLGIYLSPWDRNHPKYGTDEYNEVFINMMKEVVSRYGPLFEFWWDGANGEGPNGKKQEYNWQRFEATLRSIAPNTPVFSDIGPHIRWVGNESGFAGKTNWNLLDTAGFSRGAGGPTTDTLNQGNQNGKAWIPAECDVSIRPGWFYHATEDDQVKSPAALFNLYLKSVGRGSNLLLNVPPDRRGLLNEHDSASLVGFRALLNANFATDLLAHASFAFTSNKKAYHNALISDGKANTYIQLPVNSGNGAKITFAANTTLNCIVLQEPIQMGQRVQSFTINLQSGGKTISTVTGTTIGHKRILTFPSQMVDGFTLIINGAKATPLISEIAAYHIAESLVEQP